MTGHDRIAMTLTIKDSLEAPGTSKSGLPAQSSANSQGQSPRTNPVCLEVPVVVRSLPGEGGNAAGAAGPTRQEGRSVIVFDNGGVLRLPNPLPLGQKIILTNQQGRDVVGRVVGGRNLPSIKGYIEVEFIEPVSDFWQIHKSPDANPASTPSLLDFSDEAALLPSIPEPRVAPQPPPARPAAPAIERNAPSGSSPSFEDIAGIVEMSAPDEPREKKNEPAIRPLSAQAMDAPQQAPVPPLKISSTNIPVSPISDYIAEKPADLPVHAALPAPSRKQPHSNDSSGKVMTFSGMSSLPTPDESSGRMPLMLGGAALVLALLGGGFFYLHRGALTPTIPDAVVASQPAASPAQATAAPSSAPASEPSAEQTSQQSAQQPAQISSQPASAVSAPPLEAAASVPAPIQSARQRALPAEPKQSERAPARTPQISNLKMSSPISPGKNLPAAPESSSAAPVDMTLTSAPAEAAPSTFGARTDRQPAPPAGALVESSTPRPSKSVQPAKLISSTRPVYPTLAKQSNTQGRVDVTISIDEKGDVVAAKASSGPLPLRQAAVDAVKRWKYSPAQVDGKPSASEINISIDFRLN
jgi:periplasmic protein TonB